MQWKGVLDRYFDHLPLESRENIVSLNEGDTPLIRAESIEEKLEDDLEVYLKYEGANPTGSFKDRGMTVAVSKAVEKGEKAVICASTGNTSASAAAFAARSGLEAIVVIPEGKIAFGKLSQAMMHGATVVQVRGNFDEALELVLEISENYPVTLVNSLNPNRIEGQKTASFEISDFLGQAPDYHLLPVGNAGNITAYWKGYKEYYESGKTERLPKMTGFQAAGASPIVDGKKVENPETVATAIRIGNPASWKKAEKARDESGGMIGKATDEELVDAYRILASSEGVFCEPASAASVAGLLQMDGTGYFDQGSVITCTLTGHGLKDPDIAIESSPEPETVGVDVEAVLEVAEL
jgi:threonine synthase|uniref:Threonine synthase n=1 Tax=uncultured organism TaxID=155900 RepID=M1Q0Y3_9ZZZZ|nr:threonine synthase [uncultured organism]